MSFISRSLTVVFAVSLLCASPALGCGFHSQFKGGLTVSHPGALAVAVAVGNARREGVLPAVDPRDKGWSGFIRTRADVRRVRERLSEDPGLFGTEPGADFSLLLVGPSLWSRFRHNGNALEAQFHAAGPNDSDAIVLTNSTVVRSLLDGELTTKRAKDLGLISIVSPRAPSDT